MPRLRITNTITHTSEIEYNNEHYQDMTLDEAVQYEKDTDVNGAIEMINMLSEIDEDRLTLITEVEVIQ